MGLIKRMLRQKAVYWHPIGTNEYGEEIYASPVEIRCRWRLEMQQGFPLEGKETVYSTKVLTDHTMKIGGMLKQCTLADLDGSIPPPHDANRILMYEEIPDLKAKEVLKKARF